MKKIFIISLVAASLTIMPEGFSQGLHTSSSKATRAYNEGVKAYDYLDFNNAEINLKEAIALAKP